MGNLFSSSTFNNSKKQTKLNNRSNNITKSYAKPKSARYFLSKAPLFSNLFGDNENYNIFSIYGVNNEDLDENNFAKTFIHKILSQNIKNLDQKIKELQKLKSSIEAVRFKDLLKDSPTYSARMIIINNMKKYQTEINEVIEKLNLQKTKNTGANNKSAENLRIKKKVNSVSSNIVSEGNSKQKLGINSQPSSVSSNSFTVSEGIPEQKLKNNSQPSSVSSNPFIVSEGNSEQKLKNNSQPSSVSSNPFIVSEGNPEGKSSNISSVKVNNLPIIYSNNLSEQNTNKLYNQIKKDLIILEKRMESYIKARRNINKSSSNELSKGGINSNLKKISEYEPNDFKKLEKLIQIYKLLTGNTFTPIGGGVHDVSMYIFEKSEMIEGMKKFIEEINEELKNKNKEILKQEFNSIIESLYQLYPQKVSKGRMVKIPEKKPTLFPIYKSNKNNTTSGGSRKKSKKLRS